MDDIATVNLRAATPPWQRMEESLWSVPNTRVCNMCSVIYLSLCPFTVTAHTHTTVAAHGRIPMVSSRHTFMQHVFCDVFVSLPIYCDSIHPIWNCRRIPITNFEHTILQIGDRLCHLSTASRTEAAHTLQWLQWRIPIVNSERTFLQLVMASVYYISHWGSTHAAGGALQNPYRQFRTHISATCYGICLSHLALRQHTRCRGCIEESISSMHHKSPIMSMHYKVISQLF